MPEKFAGTFYVQCKRPHFIHVNAALNKAKELDEYVSGFKVDQRHKGHNADLIVHVKVGSEKELMAIGHELFFSARRDIIGMQPTIEIRHPPI